MANDDSLKRTYGEWLALSKADRARLGLPPSQAQWAKHYGLDSKTTTRWKQDPLVITTMNRAKARQASPPDEPVEVPESSAEGLAKLKEDLLAKALSGNKDSIEQYMKWFGKEELEAERKDAQAGLHAKTDEELIAEVLNMIGVAAIEKYLEGQRA